MLCDPHKAADGACDPHAVAADAAADGAAAPTGAADALPVEAVDAIRRIVRDYLLEHPEVLIEAQQALRANRRRGKPSRGGARSNAVATR